MVDAALHDADNVICAAEGKYCVHNKRPRKRVAPEGWTSRFGEKSRTGSADERFHAALW